MLADHPSPPRSAPTLIGCVPSSVRGAPCRRSTSLSPPMHAHRAVYARHRVAQARGGKGVGLSEAMLPPATDSIPVHSMVAHKYAFEMLSGADSPPPLGHADLTAGPRLHSPPLPVQAVTAMHSPLPLGHAELTAGSPLCCSDLLAPEPMQPSTCIVLCV